MDYSATAAPTERTERIMPAHHAAAERLERLADESNRTMENYAEVAALYFRLAWADNQPVTRNTFTNPKTLSFH